MLNQFVITQVREDHFNTIPIKIAHGTEDPPVAKSALT